MDRDTLLRNAKTQVFGITECIYQGAFASNDRLPALIAAGVSHILNVSESANILQVQEGGFSEVVWYPIADLEVIPQKTAANCLDIIHKMATQENSIIYIHCVAGQNRSPTILWLYFIALGMSPNAARQVIEERTFDAVAGHSEMINQALLEFIVQHGKDNYLPLEREAILLPQ